VAFACAADLAAALAGLTGAMGISSGAAATLVGLCPALSAHYPAARHDHGAAEDLVRHRILAIAELVAALSEEGPLAILLDDTHWMDAASRQTLMGVATRLGAERALVVSASRPTPATDLSRPVAPQGAGAARRAVRRGRGWQAGLAVRATDPNGPPEPPGSAGDVVPHADPVRPRRGVAGRAAGRGLGGGGRRRGGAATAAVMGDGARG
jgi:hypothetical protein